MGVASLVQARQAQISRFLLVLGPENILAPSKNTIGTAWTSRHLVQPAMGEVQGMEVHQCMNLSSSLTAALLLSFQLHCHFNCSDFLIDKCVFVYSLLSLYSFRVSLCAARSCLCIQVQGTKIASYPHR